MTTVLLLICSNVFMTFVWYVHLMAGAPRIVGHRVDRVLLCGACQSNWLWGILWVSTQAYSGSRDPRGIRCLCDYVSQGKARLELHHVVFVSGRCGILCVCVQAGDSCN